MEPVFAFPGRGQMTVSIDNRSWAVLIPKLSTPYLVTVDAHLRWRSQNDYLVSPLDIPWTEREDIERVNEYHFWNALVYFRLNEGFQLDRWREAIETELNQYTDLVLNEIRYRMTSAYRSQLLHTLYAAAGDWHRWTYTKLPSGPSSIKPLLVYRMHVEFREAFFAPRHAERIREVVAQMRSENTPLERVLPTLLGSFAGPQGVLVFDPSGLTFRMRQPTYYRYHFPSTLPKLILSQLEVDWGTYRLDAEGVPLSHKELAA